jgi:hypothetical protein
MRVCKNPTTKKCIYIYIYIAVCNSEAHIKGRTFLRKEKSVHVHDLLQNMNVIYNERMRYIYDSVIHINVERDEKLYFCCAGLRDSVKNIV